MAGRESAESQGSFRGGAVSGYSDRFSAGLPSPRFLDGGGGGKLWIEVGRSDSDWSLCRRVVLEVILEYYIGGYSEDFPQTFHRLRRRQRLRLPTGFCLH